MTEEQPVTPILFDVLKNSDWANAFEHAAKPEPAMLPFAEVSKAGFTREDVVKIIAIADGENDGPCWLGVFVLWDGRFAALRAGCGYTGWDVGSDGSSNVATTLADLLRYGLTEEERARLGVALEE